jgi:C4-dicarboxylate-specific signal transduction histidine kinase
MSDLAYSEGTSQALKQLDGIAGEIDNALRILRNVPRIIAGEDSVLEHLQLFGPQAQASRIPYEDRKRLWTAQGNHAGLQNFLVAAATGLDAEVIWVLNAAGDCIASSNADKAASFVGTNFGEREYFLQAKSGMAGRQYAVGKVTGVPGLYYSYPVLNSQQQFVGAVVVKRDIYDFRQWTRPNNAFIADSNGVVVLAEDKGLEYKIMPGRSVADVSTQSGARRRRCTPFARRALPRSRQIRRFAGAHGAFVQAGGRRQYHAVFATPAARTGAHRNRALVALCPGHAGGNHAHRRRHGAGPLPAGQSSGQRCGRERKPGQITIPG